MSKLSLFAPVKPARITAPFGEHRPHLKSKGFEYHNGVDFGAPEGTPARAMCEGVVSQVGTDKNAGNFVRYRTLVKYEAEDVKAYIEFLYAHAQEIKVKVGDQVKAGDILALVGSTGLSTGPHLHVSAYFLDDKLKRIRIKKPEVQECFDWWLYWNRFYAEDANKVINLLREYINILRLWIQKR